MADPADKYCCNITTYVKINQGLIRQQIKIYQEINAKWLKNIILIYCRCDIMISSKEERK